jgi:hypothetical protein
MVKPGLLHRSSGIPGGRVFILGVVASAQMLFVPGFLVLRALRLRPGALASWLAIIPLSLVINHFLVIGLVLVGRYHHRALNVVLAFEFLGLAAITWRDHRSATASAVTGDLERWRALAVDVSNRPALDAMALWGTALVAIVVLLLNLSRSVENIGTIFTQWDAVVSWNRWAMAWARNGFPALTWRYPQLLPTAVSLTYAWTRSTEVQFFGKAIMGVFAVAPLLMLGDLAIRRRSVGFLAALAVLGALNLLTLGELLVEGYADVPLAFMVLASLYLMLLARDAPDQRSQILWLAVAAVAAAGAALTKQGGIPWAVVFPVLAALEWRDLRIERDPEPARTWMVLLSTAFVVFALITPWYAYKQHQISQGGDSSEKVLVEQANGGRTYAERAKHVLDRLESATDPPVVIVLLPLLVLGALTSRRWRRPLLLYGLPYTAACIGLASYDLRNFAPVWPILATSGCCGLADLLTRWRPRAARVWVPAPWPALLGSALSALAVWSIFLPRVTEAQLLAMQYTKQRRLGGERISGPLYEYVDRNGLKGHIVTSFQLLQYLPVLGSAYVFDNFQDPDRTGKELADPGNRHLLVPIQAGSLVNPSIRRDIDHRIQTGSYRVVFEAEGYQFIELFRPGAP